MRRRSVLRNLKILIIRINENAVKLKPCRFKIELEAVYIIPKVISR